MSRLLATLRISTLTLILIGHDLANVMDIHHAARVARRAVCKSQSLVTRDPPEAFTAASA